MKYFKGPFIKTLRRDTPYGNTIFRVNLDCDQSLIFLCLVTARKTQARERRSDKRGRKREKKI